MQRTIAGLALGAALLASGAAHAGDLVVELTGVKAKPGKLMATLDTKDTFFRPGGQMQQTDAGAGPVTLTWKDLPPGEYSFMVFHDENGDGRLAMSAQGFPAEGWGMSNMQNLMGPPTFDALKFTVPAEGTRVSVPMIYSSAP